MHRPPHAWPKQPLDGEALIEPTMPVAYLRHQEGLGIEHVQHVPPDRRGGLCCGPGFAHQAYGHAKRRTAGQTRGRGMSCKEAKYHTWPRLRDGHHDTGSCYNTRRLVSRFSFSTSPGRLQTYVAPENLGQGREKVFANNQKVPFAPPWTLNAQGTAGGPKIEWANRTVCPLEAPPYVRCG